jgi:hypothetical protein
VESGKTFPYRESNSDPSAVQSVAIATLIVTTARTKDRGAIERSNTLHGSSCNPDISVAKRGAYTGRGCMMKWEG